MKEKNYEYEFVIVLWIASIILVLFGHISRVTAPPEIYSIEGVTETQNTLLAMLGATILWFVSTTKYNKKIVMIVSTVAGLLTMVYWIYWIYHQTINVLVFEAIVIEIVIAYKSKGDLLSHFQTKGVKRILTNKQNTV